MHVIKPMIVFILVFCCFQITGTSLSAERPLRVAYSSPTVTYLPLWVAKDQGLFSKYGVDVEPVSIMSQLAISALFGNEVDIVAGGGVGLIALYVQGNRDLVGFASLNNKLVFSVYANQSIVEPAKLKGKKFGVTRFGGALDFAARYFLTRSGLNPAKDVILIQIGTVPDLLRALLAGSVDAATLPVPQNLTARAHGFRELADLAQTDARYPGATFLTRRRLLVDERQRMEGFIKGLTEGISRTKAQPGQALKVLARYTGVSDVKGLESSYNYNVNNVWPRIPELRREDMKLVIEHLGQTIPEARTVDPALVVDSGLVEEIGKSNFIKKLYQ
jgi:ABC-type nitrate/sulfonate/bicarbonate transport system substrate-binding protein